MTHLINFKKQFAEAVESGEKKQTLRPARKRPIEIGDTLRLYVGLRQKGARLLKVATVIDKTSMTIDMGGIVEREYGRLLDPNRAAREDGFVDFPAMRGWFAGQYGLPVTLDRIVWK